MTRSPALAGRALTYAPAGLTLPDDTGARSDHAGFRVRERTVRVSDVWSWPEVSAAVLRWQIKQLSGFEVVDEDGFPASTVKVGDRRWAVARLGPWRIREPVRVVTVVEELDRVGFAYGTLEGHPVSGEEAFLVHREADGSILLTIRSASRPASGPWALGYPVLLYAQAFYRRRYLRTFL